MRITYFKIVTDTEQAGLSFQSLPNARNAQYVRSNDKWALQLFTWIQFLITRVNEAGEAPGTSASINRMRNTRGNSTFPEFLDIDGLMHHESVTPGESVTGHFFVEVMQRLCDSVRRKRSDKWQGSGLCVTITYRATYRLMRWNSAARKVFMSLPKHRTLLISLRVTFAAPYSENRP
jgi:hypothetical protein